MLSRQTRQTDTLSTHQTQEQAAQPSAVSPSAPPATSPATGLGHSTVHVQDAAADGVVTGCGAAEGASPLEASPLEANGEQRSDAATDRSGDVAACTLKGTSEPQGPTSTFSAKKRAAQNAAHEARWRSAHALLSHVAHGIGSQSRTLVPLESNGQLLGVERVRWMRVLVSVRARLHIALRRCQRGR